MTQVDFELRREYTWSITKLGSFVPERVENEGGEREKDQHLRGLVLILSANIQV